MLSPFDVVVVAFYFCFLLGIGWYFRRAGHDSSEYFRGSGAMAWWMVGSSAFMGTFSAWTFTGAASQAYEYGIVVLIIYWANAVGFFLNWQWFAAVGRQTRAVTVMENVRARLGAGNEQLFTWLQVPFQVLQAGIWLYGLAIFCAPVFGISLTSMIWICGAVTVFMAGTGGTWAVVVGDFVQALVLVPVTVVVAVVSLAYIGGPAPLFHGLPHSHWALTSPVANFGVLWIFAVLLEKIVNLNAIPGVARYLCVRDSRDARRAALLGTVLFLVGAFVWFIPPLVARASNLPLSSLGGSANPAETAYVTIAAKCLPTGLMGLLLTGIISATISSMDSGLNRNAGIFVRSFYRPVLRPAASERELVVVGRASTFVFGAIVIAMALLYSTWRELGAFRLMMNFSALVATPYSIPLFWSLLVRRCPDWAAPTTIGICLVIGSVVAGLPKTEWAAALPPGAVAHAVHWITVNDYATITLVNGIVGSLWFLAVARFAPIRQRPERQREVNDFFVRMTTPVPDPGPVPADDRRHLGVARMCFLYGGFVLLLGVVATTWSGRLGLGVCGAFMLVVGAAIRRSIVRRMA